jgi:type II secretory pathway component GspD/PulD (secretin)
MLFSFQGLLSAQSGRTPLISFEFIDQPVRDILYSFSTYARISIIADDTVTGTASFQFSGTDFENAFDAFLFTNRLYAEKQDSLWVVSRIQLSVTDDGITLDTMDASPSQILEKLSQKLSATIIQDVLPTTRLSIHLNASSLRETVELVMRPFSEYAIEESTTHIMVRKLPATPFTSSPSLASGVINIREAGGRYEVSAEHARIGDILDRLFSYGQREYSSFIRPDQVIERVRFSGKEFNESLAMILEQGNGEYREINGLWYIFPLSQNEIIAVLKNDGKIWRRFDVKYRPLNEFMPLIQSRFPNLQTIAMSGSMDFLALIDDDGTVDLQNYIRTMDTPRHAEPIKLKYIRTEDLFKALPPSVRREELVDAGNGNAFFFSGTPERLELFLKDLEIIDRPQPRIRYDLFIIQVQETSGLDWSVSTEVRKLRPGDMTMVTGQLGNLLNLNFDIISIFGYQFAAKINAAISENQASVFADTTLFGLSGQEIKFQNTNTYRYRDSNIDPDTGRPIYSGVTREITSGLMLNINGWVSGDGMITTTITAEVSKRGADVSSSTGNPPPTSEKILTTQVRSRSGETVVLSGLRQNDSTIVEERVPFISKIPILGWFFKSRNTTNEKTQMVIYLVPHVDLTNDEYTVEGLKTASIYSRFVEPFMEMLP